MSEYMLPNLGLSECRENPWAHSRMPQTSNALSVTLKAPSTRACVFPAFFSLFQLKRHVPAHCHVHTCSKAFMHLTSCSTQSTRHTFWIAQMLRDYSVDRYNTPPFAVGVYVEGRKVYVSSIQTIRVAHKLHCTY